MRILIRADGDRRIGTGHVMRMLALAQWASARGDEVMLASARLDDALAARVRSAGIAATLTDLEPGTEADSSWVIGQAAARNADWVIVDGYRFSARYQDALRLAGMRVLFVDDYGHCTHYAAHVVLNQNVFATRALYNRRRHDTRLLLGPAYALLRQEFAPAAATAPVIAARADRILVTLGGADPENATERLLSALTRVPDADVRVRVVVGPSNPHARRLHASLGDERIELLPATDEMAPLMAWADLAIASAGSTVYELCCLGVPTLVVAIADHEQDLARTLDRDRVCVYLGWHAALNPAALRQTIATMRGDLARRTEMSRRGRERVDGQGAERVLSVLASCVGA